MREERISDEKKRLLMDSAAREFSERGFENASYNKIIERSGLSKGTVYYYFENKESILRMVLTEIIEQFMCVNNGLSLPETVEDFWRVDCEYHRRVMNFIFESPYSDLLFIIFSHDRRINSEVSDIVERTLHFRHELIARGQSLGAVRDDMSVETISKIMREIGKVLSTAMVTDRDDGEKSNIRDDVKNFVETMRDLSIRVLTPPSVISRLRGELAAGVA